MVGVGRRAYRRARGFMVVAAAGLAVAGLSVVAQASPATAQTPIPLSATMPTAVALPTVQTDGIVWAVEIVGNTVYAGGRFSKARPAGEPLGGPHEVPRRNILAFNLTTGELLPFAPVIDGEVYTSTTAPDKFCRTVGTNTYDCDAVFRIKASPDGSRIYAAGDFATVDGVSRQRIAAFDTATGALLSAFRPALNGRVRGLDVTADAVYVGGSFTSVNGTVVRDRLAAFDQSGVVLPWAPSVDKAVWSLNAAPAQNRVLVGGNFDIVNGLTVHGLMAVDGTTGANVSWQTRAVSLSSVVTDIQNDGTAAYVSGYNFNGSAGAARFEGRMAVDVATGVVRWIDGCYGDTQAVTIMNGVLYSASHSHDCQFMNLFPQPSPVNYQRLLGETTGVAGTYQGAGTALVPNGSPIPAVVGWLPDMDGGPSTSAWKNGPWSLDNNGTYLVVGGEFLTVNKNPQQSLVRFAVPPTGPKTNPPHPFNTPTATVLADGSVRVSFPATYDNDSPSLLYQLIRSDDTSIPRAAMTLTSAWWNTRSQTLVDRSLPAGQSATYKIRVTDPDGNLTGSLWSNSVTGTATPALSRYARLVTKDAPATYWRLGETSGALLDTAGADDLTRQNGVSAGGVGALTDDPNGATTFSGSSSSTSNGTAGSSVSRYGLEQFSVETWFKTTSTSGGQLIGWGSAQTGSSATTDRKLYLDNSGRLFFGVNPGARRTINSTGTYRNGAWHHAVGTLGPDGMKLYVDGVQVAADSTVTQAQWVTGGFWRLGGDTVAGWPSAPSSGYLAGTLDEAATYRTVLSATQVAAHFAGRSPGTPTASFTTSCSGRVCTVDGSGSQSPNGPITSYAWSFGDGGTATGATASHGYAAPGTYTIGLTVTDTSNRTASTTKQVTVTNAPPTAAFTASCTTVVCSFDGSGSSDSDGTVTAYDWDFGDGSTGTGVTSSHTYASAGTYAVRLTVTDDASATASQERSVVATAAGTIASDGFGRTVTGGWGTADAGGAWTTSSTAANYAVAGGSATMTDPASGATRSATLPSVSAADVDQTVQAQLSALPSAGSSYIYVVARQAGSNVDYRARVRVGADGSVRLALVSRAGTTADTVVGTETVVSGLTLAPGTAISVRLRAVGSFPTTLQAKVWAATGPEPDWQRTATDSAAAQQAPGSVGLAVTVSSTNTAVPLTATFRSYAAVVPQ